MARTVPTKKKTKARPFIDDGKLRILVSVNDKNSRVEHFEVTYNGSTKCFKTENGKDGILNAWKKMELWLQKQK